jgi:hypothetical protein
MDPVLGGEILTASAKRESDARVRSLVMALPMVQVCPSQAELARYLMDLSEGAVLYGNSNAGKSSRIAIVKAKHTT